MWIISNDHSTLVKLDGVLSVVATSECYTLVNNGIEIGAYSKRSEATDTIAKIAELIENGAKDNYVYELPFCTYASAKHRITEYQDMTMFKN